MTYTGNDLDSWKGWLSVGCTFTSTFICFGIAYSFGAFFEPMSTELNVGRSATSAVFSITTFIFFIGGMFSGRALDRFGPKPVLLIGGLAMGLGLYLTSLVNSIWIGYLTYGLGVGIGVSCGYVPMLAVVGAWFQKKRAAATGLAVTGIGFGTLLMAPWAADLIGRYGWRQTYVIFGVIGLIVLVICGFATPRPLAPAGDVPEKTFGDIIRMPIFPYMYLGVFFVTLALFFPFVFLIPYARMIGIDSMPAASLMGILGAASIAGRLGFGILGLRVRTIGLYQLTFFMVSFSFLIWLLAGDSFAMLVFFSLLLGTGYGGFIALSPTLTAEIFGLAGLGSILGTLYTAAGFGGLIGPPIGGFLIDLSGGYATAILVAAVLAFISFLFLIPIRWYMINRPSRGQ